MKKTMKATPTLEALERAKTEALEAMSKEAKTPEAKAEAAKAEARAKEARAKAEDLAKEWREAKAKQEEAAEALEATEAGSEEEAEALEALTAEARALYLEAKEARAAAVKAEEEAEEKTATLEALTATLDHMQNGRDLCILWRMKTPEDLEAAEAMSKAREALADLAEARATAKTERDPAKAKEARSKAAALAKDPRIIAAKEAKAKAEEAAKTAPRFSIYLGAKVIDRRPTLSLALGHNVAARIAEALDLSEDIAKTSALWNVADPAAILPAMRSIAKKTAANAVTRQGTPKQWRIYAEASAGEWEAPDLADLASEAAPALAMLTAPADYIEREAAAADLLEEAAATLSQIGKADHIARAAVLRAAEDKSRAYMTREEYDPATRSKQRAADPRINADPAIMKTRAAALRVALAAREALEAGEEAEALDLATRAAYRYINNYLAEARAIRAEAKAEALDLDALAEVIADPRSIDPEAITEYEARRRAIFRAAIPEALEAMTPAQTAALKALYKAGGSIQGAEDITGKSHVTILQHKRNISRIFAAALAKTAPDSIERRALSLVAMTADLEDLEAAATLEAAKAGRAAKAKAAEAKAATEKRKAKAAEALEKAKTREDLAEAVAAAVAGAVNALPPAMKQTADLLARGTAKAEAARILGKSRATIREAAAVAAARIAEAITKAAPALDIDPRIIATADLSALFALAASIAA